MSEKPSPDTFDFPAGLGQRLRGLRRKAGLTQRQVARLMGRPGAMRAWVAQLERGRLKRPTLRAVADFLRACGASFADIADILDAYTGLKPVPDQQGRDRVRAVARQLPRDLATPADSYDIKTAAARRHEHKEPEAPSRRELRVRRLVAAWLRREKVEAWVDEVFDGLGAEGFLAQRREAREYGRRVWAALARSRSKPGALERPDPRRKTREQRLLEVDRAFGDKVELGWERLHAIRDQVIGLFEHCASTGELDRLPEMDEVRAIKDARQTRRRDRESERRKKPALPEQPLPGMSPEQQAASKRLSVVPADVNRVLEAEGMARERQAYFVRWMGNLRQVAVETRPGTAEREARLAELEKASRFSDDARRVAELYLARADRYAEVLRKKAGADS